MNCIFCGDNNDNQTNMSQNRVIPVTKCDLCNKEIAVTSVRRHMKGVHKERMGKVIDCDDCGKIYQTRARLAQHQNVHRSTSDLPKNLSCDACQYKTSNKDYLKNHKTRMHDMQPGVWICNINSCEEEPKSFINRHLLKKHQEIHINVFCPVCQRLFGAVRNMKKHLKSAHMPPTDAETSKNSNESDHDENLNTSSIDIETAEFLIA